MARAYARDYWKGAVMVSIQGYGDAQIGNAATIADVGRSMGLGDRGALLGVMCAMGESSLRNIDYGDWETNGVRNPDGTPTSSIGLFQQQAWWGSPAERMDARYAAWAFFNALAKVRDWATLTPTIAIHRVQINADPNHYAKYETPARAVLAYITEARARGVRFMGAPAIEWIRDGVGFRPDAAASFRRAEASWGSIPCNSTYRDYGLQLSMWQAWTAWTEGRGPKPNHSRALHPDESMHCQGLALDTNLWTVRGFIDHMADHGWIRTAAWDPTEQHHFEYQWWRDNHRNEPAPAGAQSEEDEMNQDQNDALARVDAFVKKFEEHLGPDFAEDLAAVRMFDGIPGVNLSVGRLRQALDASPKLLDRFIVYKGDANGKGAYDVAQLAQNEIRPLLQTLVAAIGRPRPASGETVDVKALASALREALGDADAAKLATVLGK